MRYQAIVKFYTQSAASKLDESGVEYLAFIKDSVNDMTVLIENLLQLSRISKTEIEKEEVNLSLMATEISQKLTYFNSNRHVEIEDDINVIADRGSMIIILDNLLNNAWKYSSKEKEAKVKFGKYRSESGSGFYVNDNGAGFDMNDSDKLFEVFKRLHKDSEFHGTGICLATVNRLVGKHNGKV
jgi:hypothetical protein